MKRKMSNKAKVNISNAQHNRLAHKNKSIYLTTSASSNVRHNALLRSYYHEDVVHKQNYLGRLLTKQEKRNTFLARESWNKKRGD